MSHADLLPRESVPPGLAPRLIALAVDAAAFVVAAPFVLGFCAIVLRDYWAIGAVAALAGYTVASWASCGQTLGMAAAGIALVDERTLRCPSVGQVALRATFSRAPLVGATIVGNALLFPESNSLPGEAMFLARVSALAGGLSVAWSVADHGRMLHDRLCGLAVLRRPPVRASVLRW